VERCLACEAEGVATPESRQRSNGVME